nr:ABC transporter permease [Geomicrobium sediminis]
MLRRFMRQRAAFISGIFVVLLIVVALFAPWLAPYPPDLPNYDRVMAGPSLAHWLGTDELGRDVLSRLMYGAQAGIQAALIAIIIPLVIGVPLGILSGYLGGVFDEVFMRIVDGILAIPAILLALGITAALGVNLWNAMIAIGIVFTPQFARLARSQTLQIRSEAYVYAAKVSGAGAFWTMGRHIIPNISPPIIVQSSFNMSFAILVEASLSFLGLGAQSPQISWGGMIQQAYSLMYMNPWLILAPGVAIMLTMLAGNIMGDGLRVALDPKLKKV